MLRLGLRREHLFHILYLVDVFKGDITKLC